MTLLQSHTGQAQREDLESQMYLQMSNEKETQLLNQTTKLIWVKPAQLGLLQVTQLNRETARVWWQSFF